ncbi:hypothetical protein CYMTET_47413 [Cymbomonas tetramitiformis]|uniref:Uncharacterized protein n=1 Tax=Cymbomonas tetramitiformis TaxID=36881 RepID=A0AAE0BVD0_9CHLO|nr:hypothetical protein CYMTET_47413 [Cymbomonas tetramitiformis]
MLFSTSWQRSPLKRCNIFQRELCSAEPRSSKNCIRLPSRESSALKLQNPSIESGRGKFHCKVSPFDVHGAEYSSNDPHNNIHDKLNGASTTNGARDVGQEAATPFDLEVGTPTLNLEEGLFTSSRAISLDEVLAAIRQLEKREQSVRDQNEEILKRLREAAKSLATHEGPEILKEVHELERAFSSYDHPTDVESETVENSSEHPGVLCNTRSGVSFDEANKTVTVSMQTSVSCAGDECSLELLQMDDFAAVASQVLAKSASKLARKTGHQLRGVDEDHSEIHASYLDVLKHGTIISAKPTEHESEYGHPSYSVVLRHPDTGRELEAIFKPAVEGDGDGWHRPVMEWVAYELNRMLGMDYIPPVAYRTGGVDVDFQHYEEGAFILFANNCRELREAPSGTRGIPLERLLSDTRVLDTLLHNSDRHHGHFLHGEHWSLRDLEGNPMYRPVLIDHAAGFRAEAHVTMSHENAFQTGPVKRISARTYLKLRFLDVKGIAQHFRGVLTEKEMVELLGRRNQVLAYLDDLVETQGYSATVAEYP